MILFYRNPVMKQQRTRELLDNGDQPHLSHCFGVTYGRTRDVVFDFSLLSSETGFHRNDSSTVPVCYLTSQHLNVI